MWLIVGLLSLMGLLALWIMVLALGFTLDALCRRYGPPSDSDNPLGPCWPETRARILARDNYTCRVCRGPGNVVHHVTPRRYGGTDDDANLITVCEHCHPVVEWGTGARV